MTNPAAVIDELITEVHKNAKLKGFWTVSENTPEKVMLIVTELAEYVERYRRDQKAGSCQDMSDEHCSEYTNQEIELADAVIRIFDLAGYHNYRLGDAIVAKMKYNATRPYLHGKAF